MSKQNEDPTFFLITAIIIIINNDLFVRLFICFWFYLL